MCSGSGNWVARVESVDLVSCRLQDGRWKYDVSHARDLVSVLVRERHGRGNARMFDKAKDGVGVGVGVDAMIEDNRCRAHPCIN